MDCNRGHSLIKTHSVRSALVKTLMHIRTCNIIVYSNTCTENYMFVTLAIGLHSVPKVIWCMQASQYVLYNNHLDIGQCVKTAIPWCYLCITCCTFTLLRPFLDILQCSLNRLVFGMKVIVILNVRDMYRLRLLYLDAIIPCCM